MPDSDLETKVLNELKALRKGPTGITVHSLASAQIISRLLGSGDPFVAYTRLQYFLLDATADRTVRAAAASLGFSSEGGSHLDRLEDAGLKLGGLDQRQVRRLSDKGLEVIAKLIATSWTVEAVPTLSAVVAPSLQEFVIIILSERPQMVEMSDPEIEIWRGGERSQLGIDWHRSEAGELENATSRRPIVVSRNKAEVSVVIIWRGELWPKFSVRWLGDVRDVVSETLGNKLMLRLVHSGGA